MKNLKVGDKVSFFSILFNGGTFEGIITEIHRGNNPSGTSLCTVKGNFENQQIFIKRFNFELKKLGYNKRKLTSERLP